MGRGQWPQQGAMRGLHAALLQWAMLTVAWPQCHPWTGHFGEGRLGQCQAKCHSQCGSIGKTLPILACCAVLLGCTAPLGCTLERCFLFLDFGSCLHVEKTCSIEVAILFRDALCNDIAVFVFFVCHHGVGSSDQPCLCDVLGC